MNQKNTKWPLWILAILIVLGVSFLLLTKKTANVNIVASPSAAVIVVDGKKHVQAGKLYVAPGKHSLVASFDGFATKTVSFSATKTLSEVDVVLEPNSQVGYDWLKNHPKDVGVRQNIGGNNYDRSAQALLKNFPIVGDLPINGPGGEYEISYGPTTSQGNHQLLEIDIIYYTPVGKQAAMGWLQSQGYNMSTFNIIYTDKTYQPPVVNNPYAN